jgi:hypothetical protein
VSDHRFVIDEQAFDFNGHDEPTMLKSLERLSDLLQALREKDKVVAIRSGWGAIEYQTGYDLATLLTDGNSFIERDMRLELLGLISKCKAWDEPLDVFVDPNIRINDVRLESYGVAWAAKNINENRAMSVVTMAHCQHQGPTSVQFGSYQVDVHFIVNFDDTASFFRSVFAVEDVGESRFFDFTAVAFPNLVFVDGLDFKRFVGGYQNLREKVVEHLGILNDGFMDAYRSEAGNSAIISSRIAIQVSIEGSNTRASSSLMSKRNVTYNDKIFPCEWHSKLEPHRNRIHFYPADEQTGNCILIGIFVEHLPT